MKIHLFQYDIPEVRVWNAEHTRSYSRPVMPNPSHRLWMAGAIRLTLSCWLIHEGRIPATLRNDFARHGVKWQTAPFDPSAAESLVTMAINSIRKEVQEYLSRAKESQEAAAVELAGIDAAPGSDEAKAAHKRYRSQLAAITRRVRACVRRVSVAAEKFRIDADSISVNEAVIACRGIREGMEAQARAFANAYRIIVKERGKGDAVAGAIAADDIFGPIAADYLDEMETPDAKAAASQLRSAFGYDF